MYKIFYWACWPGRAWSRKLAALSHWSVRVLSEGGLNCLPGKNCEPCLWPTHPLPTAWAQQCCDRLVHHNILVKHVLSRYSRRNTMPCRVDREESIHVKANDFSCRNDITFCRRKAAVYSVCDITMLSWIQDSFLKCLDCKWNRNGESFKCKMVMQRLYHICEGKRNSTQHNVKHISSQKLYKWKFISFSACRIAFVQNALHTK